MTRKINIDEISPDWIKELSWDLPTDWEGFLGAVGGSKEDVKRFLSMPAAKQMPKPLKAKALIYIRGMK